MDRETHEIQGIVGNLGQIIQVTSENSNGKLSHSENGELLETQLVSSSKEAGNANGEIGVFYANFNGLGSSERVVSNVTSDGERDNGAKTDELKLNAREVNHEIQGGQSRDDSSSLVNGAVLQTVIVINSDESAAVSGVNGRLEMKGNEVGLNKVTEDKAKATQGENSCVIDINCVGGGGVLKDNCDGERVCRICQLNSEGAVETTVSTTSGTTTSLELIQLGCGCKDELGIAHVTCAEAWFQLKGNRMCEICGETAKNVTGLVDSRSMEEWNVRRFISGHNGSSDVGQGCWRGQPFCNFLMACLVIAFVLPWFLRVNMF